MKVFVAGASGAMGKNLVPQLVAAGHEVAGSTRKEANADAIRAAGAEPVIMDGLDRDGVISAILKTRPDAVIQQMTGLAEIRTTRGLDRLFALTNRLRTEGTANLLAGAKAVGADRFLAQSFAGWPYEHTGGPVKSEDDPLDPDPPKDARASLAAIRELERLTLEANGIVLRYGGFYGPGSGLYPGGDQAEIFEKRRWPLIGDGGGVASFVHLEDAARATVAALERGRPGEIYNISDDDPAPAREWLPALAAAVGAKPPRHVPRWLARVLAGEGMVNMMTEARGASNEKAKRELGWEPRWPSWRTGFREALG
jgi:nucleoside-diphosphate-sugar epimerase